jgi:hypothetical protein
MSLKLYCQSIFCKGLLINGEDIANVNGNLTHADDDCIPGYGIGVVFKTKGNFIGHWCYLSYDKAQKLAEEGKVKFSRLETELGEEK